jgi:Rrf2 family cysteine metabolism transcriptional repressor
VVEFFTGIDNCMKVSAKSEYACVAMMELAANYARRQPTRIKIIADAHDISQRFLVQILLQLKSRSLVVSVRGASGGYQLARAPENISLADILGAIEDRTPATRPGSKALPGSASSHLAAVRTLAAVWQEIQAEEQRLLERISLAELLRRSQQDSNLSYQI